MALLGERTHSWTTSLSVASSYDGDDAFTPRFNGNMPLRASCGVAVAGENNAFFSCFWTSQRQLQETVRRAVRLML